MTDAYVLAGGRTPIGKFLGIFRKITAPQLAAITIRETLERAGIDAADVDEVIMGNVLSAGIGQAPARQAALQAGLPPSVAALTINKMCGSGLKAVMLAAQAVRLGDANIVVAGGMESMTRAPHLARGSRDGWKMGDVQLHDSMLLDGLWCVFDDCHMGQHAEYTAEKFGITRQQQDEFALESQTRAARAIAGNVFDEEIVPVTVRTRHEETIVRVDEGPRPDADFASLERLKPVFAVRTDGSSAAETAATETAGTVTAGNASMLSDGAAAVVVANQEVADNSPAPWRARIVASHTSGGEPRDLFLAPVAAVRGALSKAGLEKEDIDLFEINEAFAAQMLACIQELDLDPARVNVNGGAIALGHPIGASGARVLVTLLAALQHRGLKRGLASLCLGGGNAVAMIVERD